MEIVNRKRIANLGVLKWHLKFGEGKVALSKEFEEMDRVEQLDMLLDWISELESLYDSKVTDPKSWHRRIPKPSPFEELNDNTTN